MSLIPIKGAFALGGGSIEYYSQGQSITETHPWKAALHAHMQYMPLTGHMQKDNSVLCGKPGMKGSDIECCCRWLADNQ